jgi:CubicO group peptidase (beta-lactamase class C family)
MSIELTYQNELELRFGIPRLARVKAQARTELRGVALVTLVGALVSVSQTRFRKGACMTHLYVPFAACLFCLGFAAHADKVDDYIKSQMQKHHVPGLSLAIIEDGKIVKARGYGVTAKESNAPVTPSTLFQAGSISKSVAALGALHMVEQGQLALDEEVNAKLSAWKVPDNEFTKQEKVTLRRLLSHTAGITVHGFPGYAVDAPMPKLIQVLNGEKPANTAAIRVDILPGSQWRYSGGGYTIMQQMMLDVTGKPFPTFMEETVLTPLGMSRSTYEQPLPGEKAQSTATGHYSDGKAVQGRWHVYPEMAAAGLWTTASDLAHFAIGVQQSLAGKSNPVISQTMTRQMLTNQKDNDGLGVFLQGSGHTLRFTHGGRDEGFDAMLIAYAEIGKGAVIMINANNDTPMVSHILETIAQEYHWPDYPLTPVYKPIPDKEPQVTAQIKRIIEQLAEGKMEKDRFTAELAAAISTQLKEGMQDGLHGFGQLQSIVLVERKDMGENRFYRYRLIYKDSALLTSCTFNKEGKITGLSVQPE